MKKIARKNFSGLSHLASKAGIGSSSSSSSATAASTPPPQPPSSTSTHAHPSSHSSHSNGGGILKRPTWADKVRDKLPPLNDNEYEVLWERGVLGVIFLESEKDGIPYVSKATESCISPLVHAGDVLKFVNTVCAQDHTFSEFFKILATMKKPVLLRFERPASSTTSSDGEDSPLDQRSSSAGGLLDSALPSMSNGHNAKVLRSHSVPPTEAAALSQQAIQSQQQQQPQPQPQPKPSRSAFWRTVSAKDPPPAPAPIVQAPPPLLPTSSSGRFRPTDNSATAAVTTLRQHDVSPRDNGYSHEHTAPPSRSPTSDVDEYEVFWETGSLGLFFGEDRSTNLPVVTRSTQNANAIVQQMVAVNDTLVSANHVQSRDFTFEAFFSRLQQMNKPVRLVFRRKRDNVAPVAVAAATVTRARNASVTIDALTSPLESLGSGGGSARRLMTPPLPHLANIDEQEPPPVLRQHSPVKTVAARATTMPESPVRESMRESRRDGTPPPSLRTRKPELDIDMHASPVLTPHDAPLARPPVVAAAVTTAAALSPMVPARRAAPSPLNLSSASAAIMSSRSDLHRSGSGVSASAGSPSPASARTYADVDIARRSEALAPTHSAKSEAPSPTASPPAIASTHKPDDESDRVSSPLASSHKSVPAAAAIAIAAMSIDVDEPSTPPPDASDSDRVFTFDDDSSDDDNDHGDKDVTIDVDTDDARDAAVDSPTSSTLSSNVVGMDAPLIETTSPPLSSPKKHALIIQNLDDLEMETKPIATILSPRRSSSTLSTSTSRRSSQKLQSPVVVKAPARPSQTRSSSESRSPWEEAADGVAESDDEFSDDSDDLEDDDKCDDASTSVDDASVDSSSVDSASVDSATVDDGTRSPLRLSYSSSDDDDENDVDITREQVVDDRVATAIDTTAAVDAFAYPVVEASAALEDDDRVDALPAADDDAIATDVELGIVADVAIGIAVDAPSVGVDATTTVMPAALPLDDAPDTAEPTLAVAAPVVTPAGAATIDAAAAVDLTEAHRHTEAEAPPQSAVDAERLSDEQQQQRSSDLERELANTAQSDLLLAEEDDRDDDDVDDRVDISAVIEPDVLPIVTTDESDSDNVVLHVVKAKPNSRSSSATSHTPLPLPPTPMLPLSPFKSNRAVVHANLAKYKRKAKNSRAVTKLPILGESAALTVPLVAPNAVNTTVQVRGRMKPKPSMLETPDSTTYLVKWKETRSIGLQLKEVRLAKGVFPLVTDVCQEPCCELLKHVCVGDVIVEINGRNTSLMGVKKTVSFLKTCSKTTLLKLRHGPCFVPQRVSALV